MATKVYDTLEIELEDGTIVLLKPLSIKALRKFMTIIEKAGEDSVKNEEDMMDIFVEAAVHSLRALSPLSFTDKTEEEMEELVTLPTIMKILEVCGGLKPTDPNLLGAVLVGEN